MDDSARARGYGPAVPRLAAIAGQSISSDADELGCCVAGSVVAPCTCRACSAAACIWATWATKAYGSEEPARIMRPACAGPARPGRLEYLLRSRRNKKLGAWLGSFAVSYQ